MEASQAPFTVRRTLPADLGRISEIYAGAREFMRRKGNPTQWGTTEPPEDTLREDIRKGQSYVLCRGGHIFGVFAFILGDDPSYAEIDGAWRYDMPYGTLHRVASSGEAPGIAPACFDWAFSQTECVRIDTHPDNAPMLSAIRAYGFYECGIIICYDGTARVAFELRAGDRK